jgi:glyoxylase-like metal-dependent hydrolase (beta-lactamase superfamily II)
MLPLPGTLLLTLLTFLAWAAPAFSQSDDFEFVSVTKGVYAAVGKNGVVSNSAFIVNQDDVVVVDAQLRPSWAREVIAEIKKVTDKPVRYLINTHWHRDHVQGDQAYIEAFGSGVTIIQQDLTREDQIKNQPTEIATRAPAEIARLEKLLASGKEEKGTPLSTQARAQLEHQLDLQKAYLAEIPQIHLVPATMTFDRSLVLHEPNRDICLYYFGYAHTRGDTIIYLPAERVVITGDVLETGVSLMRSAYPIRSVNVLESILKLDWDYVIPGHGGVQQGRKISTEVLAYMNDLANGVRRAIAAGQTVDQAVESVNLGKYSDLPEYETNTPGAIQRAYLELTGQLPN